MTRAERLAAQEARAKSKLAAHRNTLARIQAARFAEEKTALHRRRLLVGEMADEAGLLALDDTTIASLFTLVARLRNVPNPVGVLEGLLCDPVSPVPMAVEESTAVPCTEA